LGDGQYFVHQIDCLSGCEGKMRLLNKAAVLGAACLVLSACGTTTNYVNNAPPQGVQKSLLSYGMIKKLLKVGQSTQGDVLKNFGSPNNMTYESGGGELWIYDQVVTETSHSTNGSSGGLGLGIGGGNNGAVGGILGGVSGYSSNTTSSSSIRTLTVILEFNKDAILSDISARQGGY